jgi:3-oxoacyl-[acyl-carrier protein] reductase
MARKLEGKVAVVTGASKGIGAAIAVHLAAAGAAVVVNYSTSREGADRVVSEITASGGRAVAVQGSVAKRADVERLFAEAEKAFGKVDILVNNAGIYEFRPLQDITEEHYRSIFDTNVLGLILASKEAAKYFGDKGGTIINIGSAVTSITPPNTTVYTATKGAVDAITRTLAKELGPRRIRVNAINPGMVITEGLRTGKFDEQMGDQVVSQTPLGRLGQVQDIAPAAVFLASDDSNWVTGETVRIAGGMR